MFKQRCPAAGDAIRGGTQKNATIFTDLVVFGSCQQVPLGMALMPDFAIASFAVFDIVQVSAPLIHEAIDCSILNQLSFWDSLIIASAASAGCAVLLSEDLNSSQTVLGVKISNPFI